MTVTAAKTRIVKARNLRVGDILAPSGVQVTGVYPDEYGTWLDMSDGDCGYAWSETNGYRIYNS